jgi:hypothetical protein
MNCKAVLRTQLKTDSTLTLAASISPMIPHTKHLKTQITTKRLKMPVQRTHKPLPFLKRKALTPLPLSRKPTIKINKYKRKVKTSMKNTITTMTMTKMTWMKKTKKMTKTKIKTIIKIIRHKRKAKRQPFSLIKIKDLTIFNSSNSNHSSISRI